MLGFEKTTVDIFREKKKKRSSAKENVSAGDRNWIYKILKAKTRISTSKETDSEIGLSLFCQTKKNTEKAKSLLL